MKRGAAAFCGSLLALLLSGCARPESRRSEAKPVRVSAEGTEAAEPSVASARDGTVYVAWVEHRGKEADVRLAHLDAEGRPLAQPARVNPEAGQATAWRGDPPAVAVASDGAVYVGWTARDDAAPHATALYLSASRDGGRSFGPPTRVNDDAGHCVHGMHSLAAAEGGRVYVAWLDERDVVPREAEAASAPSQMHTESNRAVYFAASADGGRTFSQNVRLAGEACPCCKTALAAGGDGRVYVGWRQVLAGDYRHIAVASTADGGRSFSAPSIVSDDRWELQGCPVSGPALAAGGEGSLRVLWYTAGEAGRPGLYWAESADGGQSFSPRVALAEAGGRGTPTLLKGEGGALTAVWEGVDDSKPAALQARLDGEGRAAVLASGGELPAAAEAAGELFVAYVAKEGEGQGVWLWKSGRE
ncbi:MAG: exo-alpha-sialidase [Acidobacteria bacterium]|nr:exo-alpha-sialidase [Acidobacteriota bacterium]